MQHGLDAAVVNGAGRYGDGAGLRVGAWVAGGVPGDVTEEGTAREESLQPVWLARK